MSTESTKTVKGRISNKHGTEEYWILSVYTDTTKKTLREKPFLPLPGELIIYDPDSINKAYRYKFGDPDNRDGGRRNVVDLPFANNVFVDVEARPKDEEAQEGVIYRYTKTTENIYAISGARKNTVVEDLGMGEKAYPVTVKDVDSLPSTGTAVIDTIKLLYDTPPIILYYNKGAKTETTNGTVHAYVDLLVQAALKKKDINLNVGWHSPSEVLGSHYKDIAFSSTLEAGYGEAGVVHEVITSNHAEYYCDGEWYEIPIEAKVTYVKRLDDASKAKFDDKDNEANINVRAYKALHGFNRVYVEGANGSGINGDYCLTPNIDTLPEDPWTTPVTDVITRIPSIPVRHEDGTIEVYVDQNSADASAISKKYFEDNLVEYVHRKPEESLEVANAGLVAAHTWTPNSDGYSKRTEKFEGENIPDNIVHLASLGTGNTLSIDTTNKYLKCEKASGSGGTTMYFTRQDTYAPAAFTFDLYLNPAEECLAKACRGLYVTPYNSAQGGNAIWSSLCNFAIISRTAGKYALEISNVEIYDLTPYIGEWFNFRMEFDDLTKGAERRIYINNKLVNKNTIGAALTGMKSFQMQILPYKSGEGSTFVGEIGIDNVYFGEVPPEVKHNGYDTITAIAYDYEEAAVQSIGGETIVSRKPDGSILTKKELTDADDDRIAASKYYVDNAVASIDISWPDNPTEGAFLRYVGGKPVWDSIQYAEGNKF